MRIALLFLSAFYVLTGDVRGQAFGTDSGLVEFTSSVPLHSFTGTSERLVGRISLADSTVDFYVDLSTLKTGIGKRDRDMRITLDTEAFPFAEFFGKLIGPRALETGTRHPVRVVGTFSLHGIAREVSVEGTITASDAGMRIEADWEVNLDDYGIVPPRLLIVKVDDVQKIRIDAMLKPEPK